MNNPSIAILGTGLMGYPMALNLLKAGYSLSVWNRTRGKAEALSVDGAVVCETPRQAVQGADIVITMLSDGPAVSALLTEHEIVSCMKKGAIFIDMSSIRPVEAREHADIMVEAGLHHLDAPVSGGTKGARDASLAIMVGGDQEVFDAAVQVFSAMGRPVRVGSHGSGQLAKLVNQAIVGVTIGVVAEAMLLAEKGGADPAAVRLALQGGFADSVILQQHGERMTTANFVPGGHSKNQLKDLNNALLDAESCDLKLPLLQQMQERYRDLVDNLDGGQLDHSAIILELKHRNGL